MAATCLFERVGSTLLIVHSVYNPTTEEWSAWIRRLAQPDYACIIVITDGGGPNASQRAQINELFKGRAVVPPCAIMTPSTAVRGIVTALHWLGLNKSVKAFAPSQYAVACDFLKMPAADRGRVLERAEQIRPQLARVAA